MSLTGRRQQDQALDVGQRDKFVLVERLTEQRATSGFPSEGTWNALVRTWASKQDLRGVERQDTPNQVNARVDTIWRVPYRADMDPELVDAPKTLRLVFKGKNYNVTAGTTIGRQECIELMTIASTRVQS